MCQNLFNDKNLERGIEWNSKNSSLKRRFGAIKLINEVRKQLKGKDSSEPITLVGHSHGGNVSIVAINMMVQMDEFKGRQINLLTINTPVRDDYQLSEEAQKRVNHVNVYDPKDPVQIRGGKTPLIKEIPFFGEIGPAGRKFEKAKNIEVDNPQPAIIWDGFKTRKGDFHKSHNRVKDWIHKTKKENK